MKRKKRSIGPVVEIILMAVVVSIICLLFSLIGTSGYKTEGGTFETTLVVAKNFFSTAGIKQILNNSLVYFQTLEPLVLVILSLIVNTLFLISSSPTIIIYFAFNLSAILKLLFKFLLL